MRSIRHRPEVTAPLLEILQFKRINGKPINATACVLTGNLMNEGAYSNAISTALLDRGAKFILSFSFDKWLDWAKSNGVHDLITAFLQSNQELACGNIDDSCYASPSPRSWTLASEALIKARKMKIADVDTITQIISGYVGSQAGLKFEFWYKYYRQFEQFIHYIIDTGTTTFEFDKLVPTEKIIFIVSLCYYAKQKVIVEKSKNKFIYLERLCNYLICNKVDPEIQIIGLHNSFTFESIAKHKLYESKIFFDHFGALNGSVTFKK